MVRGPGNYLLREILPLAAAHDIVLRAEWVSSAGNGLVDAHVVLIVIGCYPYARIGILLIYCYHSLFHDLPLSYTWSPDASIGKFSKAVAVYCIAYFSFGGAGCEKERMWQLC